MAGQWFYGRGSDITGPVTGNELKDLADRGGIIPSDTVWQDDVEMGMTARNVKNLFEDAPEPGAAPIEALTPPAAAPVPAEQPRLVMPPVDAELVPEDGAPATPTQAPAPKPPRNARAVAGKGVVIVGQDGKSVKYRMKCTTCAYEDSSWKTMNITRGTTRVTFFCPKCRKKRDGDISGVV